MEANEPPAPTSDPIPAQTLVLNVVPKILVPLDLYFTDPNDDPLAYTATSDDTDVVTVDESSGVLTLTAGTSGQTTMGVTAMDPDGETGSRDISVVVPPQIEAQTLTAGQFSGLLDLTTHFSDPNNDVLAFSAESDNEAVVLAAVARGDQFALIGVAAGETTVVVTARDPAGEKAMFSVDVTVTAAPTVPSGGGSPPPSSTPPTDNTPPLVAQPIPNQNLVAGSDDDLAPSRSGSSLGRSAAAFAAQADPPVLVDPNGAAMMNLARFFRDPDGDPLLYTATVQPPGVVAASVLGSVLTLGGTTAGQAEITVTAQDPFGGSVSQRFIVSVADNEPPRVVQPFPDQVVTAGSSAASLDLTPFFEDPDGDPLTYAAVSDDAGIALAEVPDGGSRLTVRGVTAGAAVITVTAHDPYGGSVSASASVTVRANAAPEVAQAIPPQTVAAGGTSEPLDLTPYFHDPDGDPLTYAAVSANPEVATASVTGELLTLSGVARGMAVVTVTARDPYHAEASQAVTVTVTTVEPAWVKAWAARFGRTVSGQVLDGVQERLRVARQPGFQANLAGHPIGGMADDEAGERDDRQPGGSAAFQRELDALAGWFDEQINEPMSGGTPERALTGRDLLTSTSFTLTGGDADNGFGALWGRGVVTHFAGEDGALSLDGEVATGMVGADWVAGRWLTGLTLALSRGTGGYRAAGSSGDVESTLTGLYPWVGYHLTDRLSLWSALGYGAGVLTLTPRDQASMAADLTLTLVAAGARNELLQVPRLGGVTLAGGGSLRPSVELGLRHDGGDAETGSGIELGTGLAFNKPDSGLSLDLAVRGLLTHEASGFQEWGASAALIYDPAPSSERGLSMSLQQSVGASSSGGMHALLARDTLAQPAAYAGIGGASRLQALAGYGLMLGDGRFVGTPQLGFGVSAGRHDYTLGWHFSAARREELDLTVGVQASRRENPDASNPEHGVMLQLRLGH